MQLLDKEYYLSSILDFMTLWKVTIILLGTQLYIEVSETCVLMIIKNSFFIKKVTRKNPPKKHNGWKKNLSHFQFLHFYEFFGNFFYSTWDIKLYIEVTKNYDMVMNKKRFLSHFLSRSNLFNPRLQKSLTPRACKPARANPIKLSTRLLGFLWRHQNGKWQYGFLIGPFVPRDINSRFWLVGLYAVPYSYL